MVWGVSEAQLLDWVQHSNMGPEATKVCEAVRHMEDKWTSSSY